MSKSIVLLMAAVLSLVAVQSASAQSGPEVGAVAVPLASRVDSGELAPDAEVALLTLVNQVRRQHRLPALVMDPTLRTAARSHSREMAKRGFVGHGSLTGGSFADRIAAFVGPGTFAGENVTLARSAEQAHGAFLASHSHLRNILEPKFRRVGIGIVNGGESGLFVTQDFAD